jgi:hypothetical protein
MNKQNVRSLSEVMGVASGAPEPRQVLDPLRFKSPSSYVVTCLV